MAGDDKSRGFDPEKRRRAMREQARTRVEGRSDDDPLAHLKQEPKPRGGVAPVQTMTGTVLPPITRRVSGEFDRFDSLPHMPQVLSNIQDALRTGNADAKTIAEMVGSDVGLTAQILRVVNSAYYGLTRQILDLRHAVAYLGFNEVYRIVLSVSVVDGLKIRDREVIRTFWHHSYFTALVAKYLGSLYERHVEPAELWPAALLHDVGRLVYMKIYPRYYEAVIAHQASQGCSLMESELALGVPSHTTMGSELAERWQLPEVIQDVCMNYHLADPTTVPGSDQQLSFRRLVGTASRLIDLANDTLDTELRDRTRREVRKSLKITQSEFLGLMGEVYDLRAEADLFVQE